jgi:hypothetical protein
MATSSYLVPILAVGGVSFFSKWYTDGTVDLKIPVATAVAGAIAGLVVAGAPPLEPVITGVAWIALVAVFLAGPAVTAITGLVGGL